MATVLPVRPRKKHAATERRWMTFIADVGDERIPVFEIFSAVRPNPANAFRTLVCQATPNASRQVGETISEFLNAALNIPTEQASGSFVLNAVPVGGNEDEVDLDMRLADLNGDDRMHAIMSELISHLAFLRVDIKLPAGILGFAYHKTDAGLELTVLVCNSLPFTPSLVTWTCNQHAKQFLRADNEIDTRELIDYLNKGWKS